MAFLGNFTDGTTFFVAMVTLISDMVQLFVFGIFSPGADHIQLYQMCMFVFSFI